MRVHTRVQMHTDVLAGWFEIFVASAETALLTVLLVQCLEHRLNNRGPQKGPNTVSPGIDDRAQFRC